MSERTAGVPTLPGRAARLVGATALRVDGDGPVARAAAAHLAAAGYAHVDLGSGTGPGVLARVTRRGPDGTWRPVAFAVAGARGVLVGPRNRDADIVLECAARAAVHRDGDDAVAGLPGALVGEQLAHAVLASTARTVGGGPVARWPEYLVTTPDLATRPRTLVGLRALGPGGRPVRPDAWDGRPGPDEREGVVLDRLAPLWDAVLGVVAAPLPLDLPQVPVGLAAVVDDDGRTRGGVGWTTAAARLDAVLAALRPVAGGSATGWALGLGASAGAARAEAVARLVDRTGADWRERDPGTAVRGAEVAALRAVLVRSAGAPVRVVHAAGPGGLRRVDVLDRTGTLIGRAVAPGSGAAAGGALLRAAGRLRWSDARLVTPEPDLDPLDTRSAAVRDGLDAWARTAVAAGELRLRVPDGAERWAGAGLHAVAASWT